MKKILKTEMYVELIVSDFRSDYELIISRFKEKPLEINIKGEPIFSSNNIGRISKPVLDRNGKVRKWKESFLVYRIVSSELNLEISVRALIKILSKLKKYDCFGKANFGIKCVIYLKDDRPITILNSKTIQDLAHHKCYLEIVLY